MTNLKGQNATIQDRVYKALERVMNKAMADDKAEVHLCTLELPKQFSGNPHVANDIYNLNFSTVGDNYASSPASAFLATAAASPGSTPCCFSRPGAMTS